jgi:hypothetical protein
MSFCAWKPITESVRAGYLSHRVSDRETLERRVATLEAERNARRTIIDWQFTAGQARVKLKKLYPVVPSSPE